MRLDVSLPLDVRCAKCGCPNVRLELATPETLERGSRPLIGVTMVCPAAGCGQMTIFGDIPARVT